MKTNISEYETESSVEILQLDPKLGEGYKNVVSTKVYNAYITKRWAIECYPHKAIGPVLIDLAETLKWVKENLPDLWREIKKS